MIEELEAAQAELKAARRRAVELKAEVAGLKESLEARETELAGLTGRGGWHRESGKIYFLRQNVAALELKIAHSKKTKVVWAGEPGYQKDDYIVHKVTAKRIYVCSPGNERCDMYNKDGSPVSDWRGATHIDIEATFGGPCPDKVKP